MSHGNRFRTGEEAIALVLCVVSLCWQLFVPPFIGIADNGDFQKVAARFCVQVPDAGKYVHKYFQPRFAWGPQYCGNSGIPTSELAVAAIAVPLGRAAGGGGSFDIRFAGAVHAILVLIAYALFLISIRRLPRIARIVLSLAAVWIFTDIAYTSYLNSFYTDAAALTGLLLVVSAAAWMATREEPFRPLPSVFFALAAVFFITSKAQHGIWGFVPAVFAAAAAWKPGRRRLRWTAVAAGAACLAATAWIIARTPAEYSAMARYNIIFCRLAAISPQPLQTLEELGLDKADARWIGIHAFMPNGPASDPAWFANFTTRTSYGAVLRYYLRHPGVAGATMRDVLTDWGWVLRYLPPFTREDLMSGRRPAEFGSWSSLRKGLYLVWPWHIVVWFLAVAGGCIASLLRSPGMVARRLAWICLALVAVAVGEYGFATLTDAQETFRHLFLFHAMTDVTVLFAIAGLGGAAASSRKDVKPVEQAAAPAS